MKNYYAILFLMVISSPLAAQQIPCPPTGVMTDPSNPVNNQHPNYLNNFFDWTQDPYNVNFVGGAVQQQANPYNVNNGGVTSLYGTDDFEPEDGWELLYVDLGLDKLGNPLLPPTASGQLFFVLYNKFRSIIRVFVAIDQLNQNNLTEIVLEIEGDYNTALLGSVNKVQKPLKNFDPTAVASNVQKLTNGGTLVKHWHYADFPVNYDPCTCTPPISNPGGISNLKFDVNLIDEATIELKGFSNGSIQTIVNKANASSSSSANWNDFYGTVKKAGQLIETGKKGYKSFSVFKTDAKNTATGKSKETDMKSGIDNLGSFLTNNIPELKAVPYISEALSIIDFFVGGGKKKDGANTVSLPPMSIQLEHNFSGTLTSNFNYFTKPLFTPGSSFVPNNQLPNFDDRYPLYNEILGVYTLLEKPIIEMYTGWTYRQVSSLPGGYYETRIRKWFNINQQSIKIALNPASDLNIVEEYFQLNVVDLNRHSIIATSGGSVINDTQWTSDLIPLACAEENAIIIDESKIGFIHPNLNIDDLNLSLILVFENNNGEKFLHKSTWETELVVHSYSYGPDNSQWIPYGAIYNYNWFNKSPFDSKNNGFFGATQNLNINNSTIDEDVSALETITVSNSTITATAVHPVNPGFTNVIAGHTIDVNSESDLLPNSDLQISRLGRSCDASIILATAAEINNICNSNDYQAQKIQTKIGLDYGQEAFQNSNFTFITYPNPADDFVKIALSENFSEINELEVIVMDIAGRVLKIENRIAKTANHFILVTADLKSGIYLLEVKAGGQKSVKRIFID
ncbi:T9SS type A sorting domain-containing protein [Hyphobacterium sp. CCMP332]|nr:T9SS type A sorting domain-containing protein [Hyphobacterium sp. CCMP332]